MTKRTPLKDITKQYKYNSYENTKSLYNSP